MSGAMSGPCATRHAMASSQARAAASTSDSVKAWLTIQPGPTPGFEALGLALHELDLVTPPIQHFEEGQLVARLHLQPALRHAHINAGLLACLLKETLVDVLHLGLCTNGRQVTRSARMRGRVRFDAIEVHERDVLSDCLDVLGRRIEDCLLELPSELEGARPKDVDVRAVDQQIEV